MNVRKQSLCWDSKSLPADSVDLITRNYDDKILDRGFKNFSGNSRVFRISFSRKTKKIYSLFWGSIPQPVDSKPFRPSHWAIHNVDNIGFTRVRTSDLWLRDAFVPHFRLAGPSRVPFALG